jgi:tetratricopeptide (TPR) repeat protein
MPKIRVEIDCAGSIRTLFYEITNEVTCLDLIRGLLQELRISGDPAAWELVFQGQVLPQDRTVVAQALLSDAQEIVVVLQPRTSATTASPPGAPPAVGAAPSPPEASSDDDADECLCDEEEAAEADEFEAEAAEADEFEASLTLSADSVPQPRARREAAEADEFEAKELEEEEAVVRAKRSPDKRRTGRRRATVRYYNRMNPERVYPLLVILTEQMVQKIVRQGTEQRASEPFKVDLDAVVEVEPVLPGCACYPPRTSARLDRKELSLSFHVVPHVLGPVTGAMVLIRQDHRTLAAVELDIRVVQQTFVVLCGVFTFLLPFLSAIAQHFGLDFASQRETGFSLYLAVAQILVQGISPLTLTMVLGAITAGLWWWTRPRARDKFWDIKLVQPGEFLKQITAILADDPDKAIQNLNDLLASHPDYQPAWLCLGDLQYKQKEYEAALRTYERAFQFGPARSVSYVRAGSAASNLGRNDVALAILRNATTVLPAARVSGVLWYNLGCYHARLGQVDEVVPCLRNAVRAGYRKIASYQEDVDLNAVRQRRDFKALLQQVERAAR